jgi:hypothetical protein
MSELLRAEVGAFFELKSRSATQCGRQTNARIGDGRIREVLNQYFDGRMVGHARISEI